MDVTEVKEELRVLKKHIGGLINNFEEKTGTTVNNINLNRLYSLGLPDEVIVEIEFIVMLDPENITNYYLSDSELEEHILFWVTAAGKNGRVAARSLELFLSMITYNNMSPFQTIKNFYDKTSKSTVQETLPLIMQFAGIGCYNNKARSFLELSTSGLNLRTCKAEDLEEIYGIGMKTSRCFILHSRYNARYAGLDTHMLKHLRNEGIENVPMSTPSSKKNILGLEQEVLKLSDAAGLMPANYDLSVWNKYSKKHT